MPSQIPFFLVTGYLGSGKTTFIKHFLEQFATGRKIGVVQNEYASANIDTAELNSSGKKFEVLEINNGSVFCICLLANFIDSLAAFIGEYHPEMIILEASGLSDPIAIAELIQHEKLRDQIYLAHVWSIVDAVNYHKVIQMAERLKRQIMISDTIIINKVDAGGQNLPGIQESLTKLNPDALQVETSWCDIKLGKLEDLLACDPVAIMRESRHNSIEASDRANVNTVVLKTTFKIEKSKLGLFLQEVEKKLIRMKGFVNMEDGQTLRIQSTFGETRKERVHNYTGPTEIIGIGYDITSTDFGKKFHTYRKA